MKCETIVRKIFQCECDEDPLGILANANNWSGLFSDEFSLETKFMAWAVMARLKHQYLNLEGREELYVQSEKIEEKILNATKSQDLIDVMIEISKIVKILNIQEFPYLDYRSTNDKNNQRK